MSTSESEIAFHRSEALELVADDLELLATLAGVYLSEENDKIEALDAALAAGDAGSVRRIAHSLKGAVANFCAHACVEAAQSLEMMGRSEDVSDSQEAWSELRARLKELREQLLELQTEAASVE